MNIYDVTALIELNMETDQELTTVKNIIILQKVYYGNTLMNSTTFWYTAGTPTLIQYYLRLSYPWGNASLPLLAEVNFYVQN